MVVGQFVGIPAESDAQGDPAAGQVIECGDRFRQGDGVVFDGQRDRGGQPDPGGHRGGGAEGDPGVQGAHVAVVGQRFVAGGGVRGGALDRDVGVFGHVERGEPVVVGQLGRRGRGDPTITGEQHEAKIHASN